MGSIADTDCKNFFGQGLVKRGRVRFQISFSFLGGFSVTWLHCNVTILQLQIQGGEEKKKGS